MKIPRGKTPDPRRVHLHDHSRTSPAPAVLAAAFTALLTACAGTRPVTVSHPAMGLHIDLPPGFVDATADMLHRHQARRAPDEADIGTEPMLAFDDHAGARGCLISRLATRDTAFPGISTASQMALAVSGMQGQRLTQQNTPWPLMARGQSIGLGSDGRLPASPLAHIVVSSHAVAWGPRPGWLVITQQQWPASAGAMQGATRLATLVTEAGSLPGGRRQWWMAQCAAAHMPDYVGGYLDELIDSLRHARWPEHEVAGSPLVQAPGPVPQ